MEIFDKEKHLAGFKKGSIVVNCPTLELAKLFQDQRYANLGCRFSCGMHSSEKGERLCYSNCGWGDIDWYERRSYKVVQFNGFERSNQMKKSDLKTGMRVVLRNGDERMILLDTPHGDLAITIGSPRYSPLTLNEDLTEQAAESHDIMSVYAPVDANKYFQSGCIGCNRIWTRPVTKELTIPEIERLLGCPVKIIKEA